MRVSTGAVELNVTLRGHGAPILLVHGFPLDHTMWAGQFAALAETHRVIAPDLRGFGVSQVTAGTVSMEQMADDLAALLDALEIDQPIVLCGLSMGGYVAFQFWRKYAARLQKLILCDTRAAPDTPQAAQGRLELAAKVEASGTGILAETMIPKLFAPRSAARVDLQHEVILRTPPQGAAAALRGMAARADARPWLAEIQLPTLVVVGEHDAISPVDEMRTIAEGISGAELVVVPGVGHMAPLEDPVTVNAALAKFLATA